MRLEESHKRLIRVAGIVMLFMLLLVVLIIYFSSNTDMQRQNVYRRILPPIINITLGWAQNLFLVLYVSPRLGRLRSMRWLILYLPSYLISALISGAMIYTRVQLIATPVEQGAEVLAHHFWRILVGSLVADSVILGTIELLLFRYEAERIRTENAELKMLNLQARHENLKLQLQPHFLFNSLNALKTLIRKDQGQAENYLIRLSELLRFSITHNERDLVFLGEELKVSLAYLEMQQTRFQGCLFYTVDIPRDIPAQARVPAFSLQLLLENAIKHNALTREEPLHIRIRYIAPKRILVENNRQPKAHQEAGTGLGLQNLSERYRMLVQEDIQILQRFDTFEVYLTLIL